MGLLSIYKQNNNQNKGRRKSDEGVNMSYSNQNQTTNLVLHGAYFLGTYHNPYHKRQVRVTDDNDFESLLLTRLEASSPELANDLLLTPCKGMYKGLAEPSFMMTFSNMTLSKSMTLLDIMTELFKDLGRESFILKDADNNLMIDCATGKVLNYGAGVKIGTYNQDYDGFYTDVNGVKFTLNFKQFGV